MDLKIEVRKISSIRPYARNPRINDAAVASVAASIREFGFRQPIVLDAKGVIICGHTRWKAAQSLGLLEVPVHVARDLSPQQVRALRLADNKTAELAEWDTTLLSLELRDLAGLDLTAFGFTSGELACLVEQDDGAIDAVPAPAKKATTRRGDLWTLGEHRLVCGDSTRRPDVDSLMAGQLADLVNTDPPYGVSYASRAKAQAGSPHHKKFQAIAGDSKTFDALAGMLVGMFKQAARVASDTAAWYVWHASSTRDEFTHALKAAGIMERQYLIWVKPSIVLGHSDYHWSHEPCFYASKQGHQPAFYGDRTQATVWRATLKNRAGSSASSTTLANGIVLRDGVGGELAVSARAVKGKKVRSIRLEPGACILLAGENAQQTTWEVAAEKNVVHPTQKPVELARRAIANSTQPGGVVLDVCGGSGSTLMGCEVEGRAARLMEIDPLHCDSIVARWEKFSGKKADRKAVRA